MQGKFQSSSRSFIIGFLISVSDRNLLLSILCGNFFKKKVYFNEDVEIRHEGMSIHR